METNTSSSQESKKLKSLKDSLRGKKVEPDDLVIFIFPGESIIGEISRIKLVNTHIQAQSEYEVKSPKRFIRSMFRDREGNMGISFAIGDYDLLSPGSTMKVTAPAVVEIKDQPAETQEAYLTLYLQHLEQRQMASAVQAGLELPKSPIIPTAR